MVFRYSLKNFWADYLIYGLCHALWVMESGMVSDLVLFRNIHTQNACSLIPLKTAFDFSSGSTSFFLLTFILSFICNIVQRPRREGSTINQVPALFKVLACYTLIAVYTYIKIHFISNLFLLKRQCCLQLYKINDIKYLRYVITIRLNFI